MATNHELTLAAAIRDEILWDVGHLRRVREPFTGSVLDWAFSREKIGIRFGFSVFYEVLR